MKCGESEETYFTYKKGINSPSKKYSVLIHRLGNTECFSIIFTDYYFKTCFDRVLQ